MKPGDLFDSGKYHIIKHLGEGYCSHVYLAQDLRGGSGQHTDAVKITDLQEKSTTSNLVALKVFKPGDEFRQLADVEYQLLKKLENTTEPES